MLASKFKKIAAEIKRLGLYYFCKYKITDYYYRYKFNGLGLHYPGNNTSHLTVNEQSTNNDCKINQSSGYFAIKRAFNHIDLDFSEICLLDIGCGDGKVINMAMQLKFKSVIGIELDERSVQQAIFNCKQMQAMGNKVPFSIYHADASKYTIPGGTNVIFMFNPFGEKTTKDVLKNIIHCQSFQKNDFYIIYITAVHKNVFLDYSKCHKIYELLSFNKLNTEIAVFKIEQG